MRETENQRLRSFSPQVGFIRRYRTTTPLSIGISSPSLCETFGPDKWPGSDIVVADFGMYVALTGSLETPLTCVSRDLPVPSTSNPPGSGSRPSQAVWDMSLQRCSPKRARQASRPLVYRVLLPPPFRNHSCCYGILIAHFRIITYMLLFRYTSFRSDDRGENQP